MKRILSIFLLIHMTAFTQNIKLPSPIIGWDSLQTSIQYYETNRISGYRSAILAVLEIDTTGKVNSIDFSSLSGSIQINNIQRGVSTIDKKRSV